MARDSDGARYDQLALPFDVEPSDAHTPSTAGSARLGWAGRTVDRVRAVPPAQGLRLALEFLARWILRASLPLLGASLLLKAFPYRAMVEGVAFSVEGTILHRPGLSADTSFGNWEFPAVDGLPIGVHVSPRNIDVLALARAANADPQGYAQRLQDGFTEQIPKVLLWLGAEIVLGVGLGLAAAAGINMAVRYLRNLPRHRNELRLRATQLGGAVLATILAGGYGVVSYNPNWVEQSRLTGTLAAAQLFPGQLSDYYQNRSKATDVLGSILGIQAALQDQIDAQRTPDTALRIMFISDLHLAAVYPLITQYALNYNVQLIINTGDESEFATRAELTPAYLSAIATLTSQVPMLWLAGNHDSPEVQATMAGIAGVTVLGTKTARPGGGYSVSAEVMQAFGLTIAGVPDPRVYGGPGDYGSDTRVITDRLQRTAMAAAIGTDPDPDVQYDIFATHEPVAAQALRALLPGQIRQTNSGHLHAQNKPGDVQTDDGIDLVEGSTGGGGLDNIVRGVDRPPIEFSIESVAGDCQFTKVVRFKVANPQPAGTTTPQAYGEDVTSSTLYFRPQQIDPDRVCGTALGISAPRPL